MRVLLVSPHATPPATHGAGARVDALARWLRRQGHELHFVWAQVQPTQVDHDAVLRRLRSAWGQASILTTERTPELDGRPDWDLDAWIDPAHEATYRRLAMAFEPDVVVVNYVFLSKFLEWSPSGALGYLDTHDRLSRREIYEREGIEPGFFYTTVDEELEGCRRADVVLAIQDHERAHFERSGVPVAVVGHPHPARYLPPTRNRKRTVGFAAAYNKFNAQALRSLFRELDRTRVLERLDARLLIAGNLLDGCRARGEVDRIPEQVESVGFVPDLADFYRDVDLVINPTTVGTGLKIKTVEALAYGRPLLSTSIGADGLPLRTPHHAHADVPALVAAIEEVLAEPGRLARLANVSRHIHAEYMLNLERNLSALFDQDLVSRERTRDELAELVQRAVGPLADPTSPRHISLDRALREREVEARPSIAHVVNPAPARFDSDLYAAQPITFETMRRARRFAATEELGVELLACVGRGDELEVPDGFRRLADEAPLVTEVAEFAHPRPLPLLRGILESAANGSDADYLVFTNADIAVLPHFYTFIAEKLRQGHDALIINRRTIPRRSVRVDHINELYGAIGKKHPGYDCFVFPRRWVERFSLGEVSVGVHLVGRVLLWNLLAFARDPLLVDEDHLTFHLGDDNAGKSTRFLDYISHNTRYAIDALEDLDARTGLARRLESDLSDFAPNLLRLRFSPAALSDPSGRGLDERFAKRPIFVHALFRTGSTFVWQAARRSARHVAYYEPLHEELAYLDPDDLARFRTRHTLQNRHDYEGDWLFREYEPLLTPGEKGVAGYDRRFAYETYADNSPQPLLRSYIDGLISATGERGVVLQLNRSGLRQRWFHREYPDGHHAYLVRDPHSQWASYLRFFTETTTGFSRNDAIICGLNRHRSLVRPLEQLVPLHHHPVWNLFQRYDEVWHSYDWEQRYTLFYFLWLQSLLEAAATGSYIIPMDRVADHHPTRMRAEQWFAMRGLNVDLSDLVMTPHEPEECYLEPEAMRRVETRVQRLVLHAFGMSRLRKIEQALPSYAPLVSEPLTQLGLVSGGAGVVDRS